MTLFWTTLDAKTVILNYCYSIETNLSPTGSATIYTKAKVKAKAKVKVKVKAKAKVKVKVKAKAKAKVKESKIKILKAKQH